MSFNLTFSLDDVLQAFRSGILIGRIKQRLKPYFDFKVEVKPKTKGPTVLELNITNEQQVTVHLAPKTPKGKPATLDGVPTWVVQPGGNVTLEVADDGLSCTIVSADEPGTSEVLVSADADLGEGVETISDLIQVAVGGAKASSLGLTADAPVDKP